MPRNKSEKSTVRNITKYKKVLALNDLYYDKQKLITKGKEYLIIRGGWRNLYIIDDTEQELQLYHDNVSFKYLTA